MGVCFGIIATFLAQEYLSIAGDGLFVVFFIVFMLIGGGTSVYYNHQKDKLIAILATGKLDKVRFE